LSDFEALLTKRSAERASFVAFDHLALDGVDRRLRPLKERRAALSGLVGGLDGVLFSEAIEAEVAHRLTADIAYSVLAAPPSA
jgi:ATP-dependent DNA ligase